MTVWITVEVGTPTDVVIFDLTSYPRLQRLLQAIRTTLQDVPVALIVFDPQSVSPDWKFWVLDENVGILGELVDPQVYAARINQVRNPLPGDDPPGIKTINATENDAFQNWTRAYLSKQLTINDIDAFRFSSNPNSCYVALLELKRSAQIGWLPYIKDLPNYMLAKAIVKRATSLIDLTIRYHQTAENELDCHIVSVVSPDSISGIRKRITGRDAGSTVAALFEYIDHTIDQAYTSHNGSR